MNATAALLVGILFQAAQEDPNTKSKPEMGVSISKPPKNDEWGFKDQGFFNGTALSVAHKVDELGIDILAQENGTGSFDAKAAAEGLYKDIMAAPGVTEAKKIDSRSSKLPGGGGGGANSNYVEMSFKRNDKPMEGRIYSFIGKQNQNLYRVVVICDAGMHKKHQRNVDFILSTIRTYKTK